MKKANELKSKVDGYFGWTAWLLLISIICMILCST